MTNELSLAIFKPDLMLRGEEIVEQALNDLEEGLSHVKNFEILNMKEMLLTEDQVKEFYAEHADKVFFKDMVGFMTRGPVLMIVLMGDNIIQEWRDLIGATNPANSPEGTLRKKYGISIDENSFHGSSDVDAGLREVAFFADM